QINARMRVTQELLITQHFEQIALEVELPVYVGVGDRECVERGESGQALRAVHTQREDGIAAAELHRGPVRRYKATLRRYASQQTAEALKLHALARGRLFFP